MHRPPPDVPLPASKVMADLSACVSQGATADTLGMCAVKAIREALPQAGWAGIYWLRGDELHLGPYIGPPTDHVRIPVGTGVCGTAVAEDKDQIVADVRTRENYLACTAATRSEIVVLIRSGGKVLGQIDLDSDQVGAFTADDHGFLRMVAGALGSLLPLASDAK